MLFDANYVQPELTPKSLHHWSKQTGVVLLVALWLLLLAASASPEIHHWCHTDAGQPDHSCAVILFAKGPLAASTAVFVLAFLAGVTFAPRRRADEFCLCSPTWSAAQSRGPPSMIRHSAVVG